MNFEQDKRFSSVGIFRKDDRLFLVFTRNDRRNRCARPFDSSLFDRRWNRSKGKPKTARNTVDACVLFRYRALRRNSERSSFGAKIKMVVQHRKRAPSPRKRYRGQELRPGFVRFGCRTSCTRFRSETSSRIVGPSPRATYNHSIGRTRARFDRSTGELVREFRVDVSRARWCRERANSTVDSGERVSRRDNFPSIRKQRVHPNTVTNFWGM